MLWRKTTGELKDSLRAAGEALAARGTTGARVAATHAASHMVLAAGHAEHLCAVVGLIPQVAAASASVVSLVRAEKESLEATEEALDVRPDPLDPHASIVSACASMAEQVEMAFLDSMRSQAELD